MNQINRFSSRRSQLGEEFLNQRLQGALAYDRIAGYFSSSLLEIAIRLGVSTSRLWYHVTKKMGLSLTPIHPLESEKIKIITGIIEGKTYADIAREVGVSTTTMSGFCRSRNLTRFRDMDIEEALEEAQKGF